MMRRQLTLWIALVALAYSACVTRTVVLKPHSVTVDALWVGKRLGKLISGVSETTVWLEPSTADRLRVGIFEAKALEVGTMWRASVWMACFGAALAVRESLQDWRVSVETIIDTDGLDGPSAGGLLTATMMAGMTGAATTGEFSMTGTLNPDGTIGPVRGIPQKFKAAVEAGYTHLGYPLGQRYDTDLETKKMVDLKSAFSTKGVETHEVKDVYEAYELLTGKSIDRRSPLESDEMELPEPTYKALEAAVVRYLKRVTEQYKNFKRLQISTPQLSARWADIRNAMKEVDLLLQQGLAPAAHLRATELFSQGDATLVLAQLIKRLHSPDPLSAVRYVDAIIPNITKRVQATFDTLVDCRAQSHGDLLVLIDTMERVVLATYELQVATAIFKAGAKKFQEVAQAIKNGDIQLDPAVERRITEILMGPMDHLIAANTHSQEARDLLGLRGDEGEVDLAAAKAAASDVSPDPTAPNVSVPTPREGPMASEHLVSIEEVLRSAAHANLTYFELSALQARARARKVSLDQMRHDFRDALYRSASGALSALRHHIEGRLGGEGLVEPLQLARLATSAHRYLSAAVLIAKYYSLRFRTDEAGTPTGLRREKAFSSMLSGAERMAREHAAHAVAVIGDVPMSSRVAYEMGRTLRDRTSYAFKLSALQHFWRSSLFSQLAVQLGTERRTLVSVDTLK